MIGNVGALEQLSFTAIGDTTNLAARLQAEAEPGQVVIGATTAAELTGAILEPLGALELKGKSEPVRSVPARSPRLVSARVAYEKERDA